MGFLFDWWMGLSPWLRAGTSLLLIGISAALWLVGLRWLDGLIVGVILLMFSGPSDSEKNGYHF